jgi:mono/diheme cytochrome c family protein
LRRAPALLTAVAALALAAGCGETRGVSKGGDVGQGKELFVKNCGGCHQLGDAGTQGIRGPNLDAAFAGDRSQKFKVSTIRQVVRDQIEYPSPPMPANLVKGGDADSVAAYVASVAGQGGAGTSVAKPPSAAASGPGASLFNDMGCSGCHSLSGAAGTGPPLNGVYGSKVKLATGQTVTATMQYLLESILDPDKQIVKGYQKGIMSATIKPHSVPEAKAKQLVAFIKAQK